MRWWEISFVVPDEAAEAVSGILQDWPEVQGVALEGRVTEPPPHLEYGEWFDEKLLSRSDTTVTFYVPQSGQTDEATLRLRLHQVFTDISAAGLQIGQALQTVQIHLVDETDWENAWKEHFHPLPIGHRLVIVPKWEAETYQPGHRLPIILDPGMAFGTGTHPTTQLCLEALETLQLEGQRVLDIGCGTAVLSIAAAKLGAVEVAAIDIDPVAVSAARLNVEDNHVSRTVSVEQGNLLSGHATGPQFDVAIANILRDVVILLAPQAASRLRPGGVFVTSGFVETQAEAVSNALADNGFHIIDRLQREDWVVLLALKRP